MIDRISLNPVHADDVYEQLIRQHLVVARMSFKHGDCKAALRNLGVAREMLSTQHAALSSEEIAEMEHLTGKVYMAMKMPKEAQESFQTALKFRNVDRCSLEDRSLADLRQLAECMRLTGQLAEAEGVLRQAIAALKEHAAGTLELAKAQMTLGRVLIDMGQLPAAEQSVHAASQLFEQINGSRGFWTARCLLVWARLRFAQGRNNESRLLLEQALALLEPQVGPYHPLRIRALRGVTKLLDLDGCHDEARKTLDEIQRIEKRLREEDQ